jgi:hypothetical protein
VSVFNKNKNLHVEDFRVWCTVVQVTGSTVGVYVRVYVYVHTPVQNVQVHTCACVYTTYTRDMYHASAVPS